MCAGRHKDDVEFKTGARQPMEDQTDQEEQRDIDSQADVIIWLKDALDFIYYWGYIMEEGSTKIR